MLNWLRKFSSGNTAISAPGKYDDIIAHITRSSTQPYISISAIPDENLSLTQSKFGGLPYLPKDMSYPTANGKYLYLLAQLNFSEIPYLSPYPEKGILQFYLADDDIYGINSNDPVTQSGFRVIYFPDIDHANAQDDFSFLPPTLHSPLSKKSYWLAFEAGQMPVIYPDYRFDGYFKEINDDAVIEAYIDKYHVPGHRIGGYAYFTQSDPRGYTQKCSDMEMLLLQIDSDENIYWGDMGVANFFISKDDLLKRDFSRVMYNWDCH